MARGVYTPINFHMGMGTATLLFSDPTTIAGFGLSGGATLAVAGFCALLAIRHV